MSTLPATPSEAKKIGSKYYFTGIPCKRGHVSKRRTSNAGCTECQKEMALWRFRNIPKVREQNKAYKQTNEYKQKEEARRLKKITYRVVKQNIDVSGISCEAERKRVYAKLYARNNKERIKAQSNKPERKEKRKNYVREWMRERSKTEQGKAEQFMRKCIYRCLDQKTERASAALGYKPSDLIKHIQEQFESGMTWENHGVWHIDHIKPISAFLKEGVTCPKTINALANLRPLWACENLSKGDKHE